MNFLKVFGSGHLVAVEVRIAEEKIEEKTDNTEDNRAEVLADRCGTQGQENRDTADRTKNRDELRVSRGTASKASCVLSFGSRISKADSKIGRCLKRFV